MYNLIFSIVAFVVIYLLYVIFVISRKSKIEKFKKNSYVTFLVTKYNVDLEKTNIYALAHAIALTNSFIVSSTLFIISYVSNVYIMLVGSLLVIVPLQLLMYALIGHLFGSKK